MYTSTLVLPMHALDEFISILLFGGRAGGASTLFNLLNTKFAHAILLSNPPCPPKNNEVTGKGK